MSIADEFYKITCTAINKDKSQLIIISEKVPDVVALRFGNDTINIRPVKTAARFLGVWINASNSPKFVVQQCKDITATYITIMKTKIITDKQLAYLINAVIFPTLLYRCQITYISPVHSQKINSMILSFFKNKMGFARSAPDCLFTGRIFYRLNNFTNLILQQASSHLLYRFNSTSLLNKVAIINLYQLQTFYRRTVSPLHHWNLPLNQHSYRFWIGAMLSLMNNQLILITPSVYDNLKNNITGGSIPIHSILKLTQITT